MVKLMCAMRCLYTVVHIRKEGDRASCEEVVQVRKLHDILIELVLFGKVLHQRLSR